MYIHICSYNCISNLANKIYNIAKYLNDLIDVTTEPSMCKQTN